MLHAHGRRCASKGARVCDGLQHGAVGGVALAVDGHLPTLCGVVPHLGRQAVLGNHGAAVAAALYAQCAAQGAVEVGHAGVHAARVG